MNGAIEVRWIYPDSLTKNIQGFVVARAKITESKNYKDISKILPPTTRSYEDMKPEKEAYYVIKAVDIYGKVALSFPIMGLLKDSIPPKPPTGLLAKVDSMGIVRMKWQRNREEDMSGYRVFMSNSLKEEFMLISKGAVSDTFYTDTITLNTLTKKVYYKLVAIDQHFNPSAFSTVAELKRPDIVPPSAPVLDLLESLPDGIQIKWRPSTSSDVVAHVLYRRVAGEKKWITIAVVDSSKKERMFMDKGVEKRKSYEYTLLAVDDSKLESPLASPIEINYIDDGKRPEIQKFKATVDKENKRIDLKWEYELKTVQRFLIYKAENGGTLRLYKSVVGTEFSFTDKNLFPNTTYQYRVKAVLVDGGQSNYSKEMVVVY
jgi:fibronectin type 3 domain-containing protein